MNTHLVAFLSLMNASLPLKSSKLKDLPEAILKDLLWSSELVDLPPGHSLFRRGDPLDGTIYLIAQGTLEILYKGFATAITQEEKDRLKKVSDVGEFCGSSAFFRNQHERTADVRVGDDGARLLRWKNFSSILSKPEMHAVRAILERESGDHWIDSEHREF